MTVAWIFPGQGSQTLEMGKVLIDVPEVKPQLDLAREILGWCPLQLSAEQLRRTLYTQPALFTVSALLADQLLQQGKQPDCVAGHSLGEYVALFCAGVFDFATGLRLVKQRAVLMDAGHQGTMAAVIGFDREKLEQLCASQAGVAIANDNSPDQVVITGTESGVQAVVDQLGAKRVVPLPVSGPFHSTWMADAAAEFAKILNEVEFQAPKIPIYCNVDARPILDPMELKQRLAQQMTSAVQWHKTVVNMVGDGVTAVWEIGPGRVLTGLVKRIAPELERINIYNLSAVPA